MPKKSIKRPPVEVAQAAPPIPSEEAPIRELMAQLLASPPRVSAIGSTTKP
jgi:hypothetical protein